MWWFRKKVTLSEEIPSFKYKQLYDPEAPLIDKLIQNRSSQQKGSGKRYWQSVVALCEEHFNRKA